MGNLTDVIRIASRRPLKDAAFFIAFNIRIGRIEEATPEMLKSSQREASDTEINQALAASNVLEAYCLAIPPRSLNDRDKARSVLQKAKDDNPGFIPETYLLLEGYIRAGEENVAPAEQFGGEKDRVQGPDWADTFPGQFGIERNLANILQWISAVIVAILSYFALFPLMPFFFLEPFSSPSEPKLLIWSATTIFFPLFLASIMGGIAAPSAQAGLASTIFPLSTFLLFNLMFARNAQGHEIYLLSETGAVCAIAALCLDVRRRWRRSKTDRAKRGPEARTV